jgi:hypothetical protein
MQAVRITGPMPLLLVLMSVAPLIPDGWTQKPGSEFHPAIPKTWDDAAMATLEAPLAHPIGSPKHVSADYYYRIPVRPIYKSYPVYAPGHEPPGYMDGLKQQEPVIVWDDKGHAPPLKTEADWIKAGEIVFDSPIASGGLFGGFPQRDLYVRETEFYRKTGTPVAGDGTVPFYQYVIMKRGEVKIGILACAMCHPLHAGWGNSERGPG